MIQIKQSKSADSRTAEGPVTKNQLFDASLQHISDVNQAMIYCAHTLIHQARKHDYTKLNYIDMFHEDFTKGYKGDEFKKAPWFQKHLTERHHLTDRVPDDVNLFDVIERACDIVMAGLARSGEVYPDTLSADVLLQAYHNTIELLKLNTEVLK